MPRTRADLSPLQAITGLRPGPGRSRNGRRERRKGAARQRLAGSGSESGSGSMGYSFACGWRSPRAGREPCLLQCNMCPELSKAKVPAASLCWEGWPVHWWMRDIPSYRRWPAQAPIGPAPSARPGKQKAASAERAACGRWPAGKLSPLSGRWLSPVRQSARARWRGGR